MKKVLFLILIAIMSVNLTAQSESTPNTPKKASAVEPANTKAVQIIELPKPSATRKCDIMKAMTDRKSTRTMKTKYLNLQDLSDILWAAKGINRPGTDKMTTATARNSHDIDVYLCRPEGVYIYSNEKHILELYSEQDIIRMLDGERISGARDILLIVADMSKYKDYDPKGDNKHFYEMGAVDAGIVSQSISLMCAAANIATVPRARMMNDDIHRLLGFGETQVLWLNHPLGYFE